MRCHFEDLFTKLQFAINLDARCEEKLIMRTLIKIDDSFVESYFLISTSCCLKLNTFKSH